MRRIKLLKAFGYCEAVLLNVREAERQPVAAIGPISREWTENLEKELVRLSGWAHPDNKTCFVFHYEGNPSTVYFASFYDDETRIICWYPKYGMPECIKVRKYANTTNADLGIKVENDA